MSLLNKYFIGFVVATASLVAQAATRLELDSYGSIGPDPFITWLPWELKGTETFTAADGTFFLYDLHFGNPDYANSVTVSYQSNIMYTEESRWIYLTFATDKLGQLLDVGTYLEARRPSAGDLGYPGLDLSDTGRAFTTSDGQFHIFDLKRDMQGNITTLAASFAISSYPAPAGSPVVGGRFWYNSDAAITAVPTPTAALCFVSGLVGLMGAARRRTTTYLF